MSREIKFRAFSGISMVESDEFTIDGDTGAVRLTSYSSYGEPTELMDSWTLMQYTGLKDKNGVEIYENDVLVKLHCDAGVVEFLNGSFSCKVKTPKGYRWYHIGDNAEISAVVGNIHENPELLEKNDVA